MAFVEAPFDISRRELLFPFSRGRDGQPPRRPRRGTPLPQPEPPDWRGLLYKKIHRRTILRSLSVVTGVGVGLFIAERLGLLEFYHPNNTSTFGEDIIHRVLSDRPENFLLSRSIPQEYRAERPQEQLDLEYLNNVLIPNLEAPKATEEERLAAVLDNISLVRSGRGYGSALRIDESGYYLTVSHNFYENFFDLFIKPSEAPKLRQPTPEMYHPLSGIVSRTTYCLVNFENDLVIVFAPNGRPRRPTENLQISLLKPSMGERLWLLGAIRESKPRVFSLGVLSGLYDAMDSFRIPGSERYLPDAFFVKGLKPYGGSSGAPIVNNEAIVVGIEQGTLPATVTDRSQYLGAIAMPLSLIKGKLQKLQVK